ncbi:unnamed protein product [Diplocarpon coronariae]
MEPISDPFRGITSPTPEPTLPRAIELENETEPSLLLSNKGIGTSGSRFAPIFIDFSFNLISHFSPLALLQSRTEVKGKRRPTSPTAIPYIDKNLRLSATSKNQN